MPMRLLRERGRPRGKHYSSTNIRRLEYIALVSAKYGIDSERLFNSFVEAWKNQESKCKSLLIKCRMKTRDEAVFLVTNNRKVTAQLRLPTHILEKVNPLREFAHLKTPRRTTVEGIERKHLQIRDLKSGMNRISLRARVLEIPKPRSVITKFGGFATVTNASITDETGIIQLSLWNKQIDEVSVGDIVQVENARVVTFRGEPQLRINRGGQVNVGKNDLPLENSVQKLESFHNHRG